MKEKKCAILIDGSNFYFKLKDLSLHHLISLDFKGFAKWLAGKDKIVHSRYYVGAVRTNGTEKSLRLFRDQRKLLSHLKRQGFNYSLGYLLKSKNKIHEKGVDVNIAVDMLVATYENLCDRIILVSSDTDLLPSIKKAKEKGKMVEYIGFSHQPSIAMVANCSKSRLLTKEDLLPFVKLKK